MKLDKDSMVWSHNDQRLAFKILSRSSDQLTLKTKGERQTIYDVTVI